MKTWMWKIWAVAILPTFAVAAQDVLVYDNTTTDTGYALMFTNNQEIGDQIWLDNATHPYLTGFSFEYYSPNLSFSQTSIAVDVRFYLNDGSPFNGYSTPSTLFYDTGWFDVQTPLSYFPGTNVAVLSFTNADLYTDALLNMNPNTQMPSNFTFTVTFQGLSGSDQVGLPSFEPPAVGTNYGDYWWQPQGSWQLWTNSFNGGDQPIAWGAQLYGTNQPTPEPTTLCLAAVGAALLAGFARRRRQ